MLGLVYDGTGDTGIYSMTEKCPSKALKDELLKRIAEYKAVGCKFTPYHIKVVVDGTSPATVNIPDLYELGFNLHDSSEANLTFIHWPHESECQIPEVSTTYNKISVIVRGKNHNILLVRDVDEATWRLPSGESRKGESLADAARRILLKEVPGIKLSEFSTIAMFGGYNQVRARDGFTENHMCFMLSQTNGVDLDQDERGEHCMVSQKSATSMNIEPKAKHWLSKDLISSRSGITQFRDDPDVDNAVIW